MLPHQTQHSFQHDAGDETTVIYSELKINPVVKEEVASGVDEKLKETAKKMQGDEGELAVQSYKEESACIHIFRTIMNQAGMENISQNGATIWA